MEENQEVLDNSEAMEESLMKNVLDSFSKQLNY